MLTIPRNSLLLRFGIAMAVITALAFVSMLSSVFSADTSEGFAAAINQAGTLRMQSYRIASSLVHGALPREVENSRGLVEEFEGRLTSPRIVSVLGKGAARELLSAYTGVSARWTGEIRPMLDLYLDGEGEAREAAQHRYLAVVDEFVAQIDHLVKVLELDAEARVRRLRIIQSLSLLLTVSVVVFTLLFTHSRILLPLRDLLVAAQAARHGDFGVRVQRRGEDELGHLGAAFNVMAEDLSKMYGELEARVRAKTADLERSNRSLELLYRTTRRLSGNSPNREVMEGLIGDIEQLVGVKSGTLCLGAPGDEHAFKLASSSKAIADGSYFGRAPDCARCMGNGEVHRIDLPGEVVMHAVPIRDQSRQHGVLLLELGAGRSLEAWQERLLETVASHIAFAFNAAERAAQVRVLSLQEERSVIARELHDSLAQALSYLKIQVSLLEMELRKGGEEARQAAAFAISAKLREGLNSAYRQLRELLTTFRLRSSEAGLAAALEETVREFRERAGLEVELVNRMVGCRLSPNEEIHLLQIVREALSNVVRHAEARHATVRLGCDLEGEVRMTVEDDGVGLGGETERPGHYGLSIMSERSRGLGGTLTIANREGGGARVELRFRIAEARRNPDQVVDN